MNTHLLVIDPQNDFCDIPGAALPVPGANADLSRLAQFLMAHAERITDITVTLDSHASVAVERTTFWTDAEGKDVAPFTFITPSDVRTGKFRPRNDALKPAVQQMLNKLASNGHEGMVVWPVHCVTGTWGHNIHTELAQALAAWEMKQQKAVTKVLKGEYPLSEHFGVFEADAPDEAVPSTLFNEDLADKLLEGSDLLLVAGEASSHCVPASYYQLMRYGLRKKHAPRVALLRDCMSPVPGFEAKEQELLDWAAENGTQVVTTAEAANLLG